MSKPFDYYAGYPGQQATPKWVGFAVGSLFGGMFLVALAIGIKLLIPTRKAEASVAPKHPAPIAAVAPAPAAPAPVIAPAAPAPEVADATPAPTKHGKHHAAHASKQRGKGATQVAAVQTGAKYKKAQMFAKSVSRKDKKARDDLDKMLGL